MKNKKYLVIGMAVILVVAAILVGVLVFGRGEEPEPTEPTGSTAEGTQPGDATEGTQVTEGTEPDSTDGTEPDSTDGTEPDATDGTEPDSTDGTEPDATEGTEPDSTDGTQPDETEPSKTEPAETEPAETKPAETEPAETKPAETEPAETKPDSTEETYHVHDYDSYEISPTCTEPGYKVFTCVICGHESKDQRGSRLGHNWISDWVITKEPTVDAPGAKQRTCSRCGVFTEAIPALDAETGEAYESYIDPRITVKEYRTCVGYDYEEIAVTDFRTWGDPPSIWVNEDGSLTVVYYQQNGTRVEVVVEVPEEGYIGECVILDDGTYFLTRTGSYANSN